MLFLNLEHCFQRALLHTKINKYNFSMVCNLTLYIHYTRHTYDLFIGYYAVIAPTKITVSDTHFSIYMSTIFVALAQFTSPNVQTYSSQLTKCTHKYACISISYIITTICVRIYKAIEQLNFVFINLHLILVGLHKINRNFELDSRKLKVWSFDF